MKQDLFSRRLDALCYLSAFVLFLISIPLQAVGHGVSFVIGSAGIMVYAWQGYRIAALLGVRVFPFAFRGLPLATLSPATFRQPVCRLRAPAYSDREA
jgi:hypothetical protein